MPDSPTGAPLRQQIAEALGADPSLAIHNDDAPVLKAMKVERNERLADAVVALLNLTEEPTETLSMAPRPGMTRWVGPWRLPSTHPDTSSSETT